MNDSPPEDDGSDRQSVRKSDDDSAGDGSLEFSRRDTLKLTGGAMAGLGGSGVAGATNGGSQSGEPTYVGYSFIQLCGNRSPALENPSETDTKFDTFVEQGIQQLNENLDSVNVELIRLPDIRPATISQQHSEYLYNPLTQSPPSDPDTAWRGETESDQEEILKHVVGNIVLEDEKYENVLDRTLPSDVSVDMIDRFIFAHDWGVSASTGGGGGMWFRNSGESGSLGFWGASGNGTGTLKHHNPNYSFKHLDSNSRKYVTLVGPVEDIDRGTVLNPDENRTWQTNLIARQSVGHVLGCKHEHGTYDATGNSITDITVMASGRVFDKYGNTDLNVNDGQVSSASLVRDGEEQGKPPDVFDRELQKTNDGHVYINIPEKDPLEYDIPDVSNNPSPNFSRVHDLDASDEHPFDAMADNHTFEFGTPARDRIETINVDIDADFDIPNRETDESGTKLTLDASPTTVEDSGDVDIDYEWTIEGPIGTIVSEKRTPAGKIVETEPLSGGRYEILLLVVAGEQHATTSETITVSANSPPEAVMNIPSIVTEKIEFELDGSQSSDPDNDIVAHEWTLSGPVYSDGGSSSSVTGTYVYPTLDEPGFYHVDLNVVDEEWQFDSERQILYAQEAVKPDFETVQDPPKARQVVTFDAAPSKIRAGDVDSYTWEFPGGRTATGRTVDWYFGDPGEKRVHLTVRLEDGSTYTTQKDVAIDGNDGPSVSIDQPADTSGLEQGETVDFEGSASGKTIDSYEWFFYREGTKVGELSGESCSFTFSQTAEWLVVFRATADDGTYADRLLAFEVYGENETPNAQFDISSNPAAPGEKITLDAAPSWDPDGSIASYEWQYGTSLTESGQTVEREYALPGEYTATLTVTDDSGIQDSVTRTIEVTGDNESPTATIDNPESAGQRTVGQTVDFEATASDPDGSIDSTKWVFNVDGDYHSSTQGKSVTRELDEIGDWAVSFRATDDQGATTTRDLSLEVVSSSSGPQADIQADRTMVATGVDVVFDARDSSDPNGSIVSYDWTFGDGASATGERPTHEYDDPGEYTAKLTVTDDSGRTDTAETTIDVVADEDGGPTVSIDSPGNMIEFPKGADVTFNGSAEDPDGIDNYEWLFQVDGELLDKMEGTEATKSFDTVGDWNVAFEATDELGNWDYATREFDVYDPSPTATITSPGNMIEFPEGEAVTFNGSAEDPDSIDTYEWEFRVDGELLATRTGKETTKSFDTVGHWEVTFKVTDYDDYTDEATREFDVYDSNQDPVPTIESPTNISTVPEDTELAFSGTATDPDGDDIVDYDWLFQVDGQLYTSGDGTEVAQVVDKPGHWGVTFRVYDEHDEIGIDSMEFDVTDENEAPAAGVTTDREEIYAGQSVTFEGSSSSDSDGSIATYEWAFGDGSTATGETVSHTYDDAGEYTATLTVTDDDGAADTAQTTTTVKQQGAPTAAIETTPESLSDVGLEDTVTFDGSASQDDEGVETYEWTLSRDDTTVATATSESFTHTFETYGSFEVQLAVTDADDLTDGATEIFEVDDKPPVPTIKPEVGLVNVDRSLEFSGEGTEDPDGGEIAGYTWYFYKSGTDRGAEIIRNERETTVTFDQSQVGDWTVKLRAEDDEGSFAVAESSFSVVDPDEEPLAKIAVPESDEVDGVVGEAYRFLGYAADEDGIADWGWDVTDEDGSLVDYADGREVTFTFDDPGEYYVNFQPVDPDGNFNIDVVTMYVAANETPTASIAGGDRTVQPGQSVSFDGSGSTDPDGDIQSYEWAFGDGTTATGATVDHTYASTGEYTATLTVTDEYGATDSTIQTVTVEDPNEGPTASFTTSTDGLTVSVDASDSSDDDGISSYEWRFGDLTSKSSWSASHTYDSAGTYTITLEVTDTDGATDSTSKSVTVEEPNDPPTPVISAPTTVKNHERVVLDGSESTDGDGSVAAYEWTVERPIGTNQHSGETVETEWSTGGEYTVSLTVTDDDGARATSEITVTVTDPISPSIEVDPEPTIGEATSFTATLEEPDRTLSSVEWTIEGTRHTGSKVRHTFWTGGFKNYQVTVTTEDGATEHVYGNVYVESNGPIRPTTR